MSNSKRKTLGASCAAAVLLVAGSALALDGDVNGDGAVNPLDIGFVVSRFGCPVGTGDPNCDAADANGDGAVDPLDSGYVTARFGTAEPPLEPPEMWFVFHGLRRSNECAPRLALPRYRSQ